MRLFLIGCGLGFVSCVFLNVAGGSTESVGVWSVLGGLAAVFSGLALWLKRKTTYQCGSKSFLRGLGSRLFAIGLLTLVLVGLEHFEPRHRDPTLRDESGLVSLVLVGGVFGLVGAVLWYLGDRKSALSSLTDWMARQ